MPLTTGRIPRTSLLTAYLALPFCALLFAAPGVLERHETGVILRGSPLAPDPARMLADVQALAGSIGPRVRGTPEHEAALRYLEDRFRELELVPLGNVGASSYRFASPAPDGGPPLKSVVGARSGSRPSRGYRLLSAHYDTVPGSPGAEDDASGVAVVLEVARLAHERRLADDLLFAVFDGEEDGLLGSEAFAAALGSFPMGRPEAMLSLEMCGWERGSPTLHTFSYADVDTGRRRVAPDSLTRALRAWASATETPLALGDPWLAPFYPIVVRTLRAPHGSDDGPFTRRGIPAAMLATSSFTRFYPHYHRATDTEERVAAETLEASARIAGSFTLHGAPSLGRMREAIGPLELPLLGLAAALPALLASRRRRSGGRTGKIGLTVLFAAHVLAFPAALAGATLGLLLWPAAAGRPLSRRLALLAVAALPLVALLATLGAVVNFYGSRVVTAQSAWPLAQLAAIAAGLVLAYAGAPNPEVDG